MLKIQGLKKVYGQKAVLDEVSYHFQLGERIALVGDNGAGKTTLLNILCGLEDADQGEVVSSNDMVIGYLPQQIPQNPHETIFSECLSGNEHLYRLKTQLDKLYQLIAEEYNQESLTKSEKIELEFRNCGGYELNAKAEQILLGLGFDKTQFELSPLTLSGGWRMRLELAKLFVKEPTILILDEPTNHLDLPSMVWTEKFLLNYTGTVLFVSHDRELLRRLSSVTLALHQGSIYEYKGNYDFYIQQWALEEEQALGARKNLEKKQKQLQTFVDRFGAKATKAKQAHSKSKMIDRLKDQHDQIKLRQNTRKTRFQFIEPKSNDKVVARVSELSIGYDKPLCEGVDFELLRGQKLAIVGANGIGKSTLLKTLIDQIQPLAGTVSLSDRTDWAYYAQDQSKGLVASATVLENLLQHSTLGENEARGVLGAFLFSGEDVFKEVSVLSGGEKARLGLAIVLAKNGNLLIMDEPTNHLDMASVSNLSEAIHQYQGTMLVVSHDRYFIDQVCDHLLVIDRNHSAQIFLGNFTELEGDPAFQEAVWGDLGSNEQKKVTSQQKANQGKDTDKYRKDKELRKIKQQVKKLEATQEVLREELSELDKEMHQPNTVHSRLVELQDTKDEKTVLLDQMDEEWLNLQELLDD